MDLFLVHFLYLLSFLDDNVHEESKKISNGESLASGCRLTFAQFFTNFSLALLIKVLFIKKCVSHEILKFSQQLHSHCVDFVVPPHIFSSVPVPICLL